MGVPSVSSMSTSTVGVGVDSLAGVGSLARASVPGEVDKSTEEGSSSGGEGGKGEGLFEDMSLRVGDLLSFFTDVDSKRSRCTLSSCACCNSLRLNDRGGFISLIVIHLGTATAPSSSVCVAASA
jgi:hypothetical protein